MAQLFGDTEHKHGFVNKQALRSVTKTTRTFSQLYQLSSVGAPQINLLRTQLGNPQRNSNIGEADRSQNLT